MGTRLGTRAGFFGSASASYHAGQCSQDADGGGDVERVVDGQDESVTSYQVRWKTLYKLSSVIWEAADQYGCADGHAQHLASDAHLGDRSRCTTEPGSGNRAEHRAVVGASKEPKAETHKSEPPDDRPVAGLGVKLREREQSCAHDQEARGSKESTPDSVRERAAEWSDDEGRQGQGREEQASLENGETLPTLQKERHEEDCYEERQKGDQQARVAGREGADREQPQIVHRLANPKLGSYEYST